MASGARLRSTNQAFGRSRSNAFLLSAEPPPQPVETARVPVIWDYVNAATNVVASDLCEDRNPPDPTPGPSRPDIGNITGLSRFRMYTQCFIRDFSPGFNMKLIGNAGDPDEFELPLDMTANGLPFQAFSNYDPGFYVFKNNIQCLALIAANPILSQSAINGGVVGDYDNNPTNPSDALPGTPHRFEIRQFNSEQLPTDFGRNAEMEIPLQAAWPITAFVYSGLADQVATSANHGLLCGSAVRIFDFEDPPNEITVRINDVTTDTFTWNRNFQDEWIWGQSARWRPAYGTDAPHVDCP